MVAVAFGTLTAGAAATLYFNTKDNTSWNSPSTYAVFYDASGKVVEKKPFVSAGSNMYSVAPSTTAATVQLVQLNSSYNTWPPVTSPAGKRRIVFKNTGNWTTPYIYAWSGGGGSGNQNAAYPGVAMTHLSGDLWYYDSPYEKMIFNHGVNDGNNKTADLSNPAKDNDVYSYASGWAGNLYSKSSQTTDFSVRNITGCSDANEIYVSSSGKLTLSKFPKDARTFSGREKTVYLYNPNWTSAYVTYDYADPYRSAPLQMTAVSGKPAGFFQAVVPSDAHFKFTPGTSATGSSQEAWFGSGGDNTKDCYVISGSNEHWATLDTATEDKADYYAVIGSDGNKNAKAFWVEATYFDYLDDQERTQGWLKPKWGGTVYNNDSGEARNKVWYPFVDFNKWISQNYGSTWANPLYFGNFYNDNDQNNYGGTYSQRTGELTNFVPLVNNSNAPLPGNQYSVLGIAADKLDSNGNLMYPTISGGTAQMPYFDREALGNYAKTVSAYFPFNAETQSGITTYRFNSAGKADNVSFKYESGTPTAVNFSSKQADQIMDGQGDFMYKDTPNVGIFPFNGGINNPGNGKLDYGFGIKLDMDFRVPDGGKNANKDVQFTYSGDDDLWVYISPVDEATGKPDYSKSKLALDLGGDHKMSEGNINFQTMKSYVKQGVKLNPSTTETVNSSDALVIVNSNGNKYTDIKVYAWKENVSGSGKWFSPQPIAQKTSNGETQYVLTKSSKSTDGSTTLGDCNKFLITENTSFYPKSPDLDLNSRYGKYIYTDHFDYTGNLVPSPFSFTTEAGALDVSGYYDFADGMDSDWNLDPDGRLDPDTTYHLTIFYMERGLINSNNKMTFSMTPASNLLQVHKQVNADGVNEDMQADVKSKDSFGFDVSDTATFRDATLKDGQSTEFSKVFKTGNTATVTERITSNFEYDTAWNVYDPDTGTAALDANGIAPAGDNSGTGLITSFKLTNPTREQNIAKLRADFVNTPQTAPLTVTKTIIEEDGSTEAQNVSSTFNFTIGVDLNGGDNYKYYDLDYEVSGHNMRMDNGKFSFNSNESVVISGIPVGAKYLITEEAAAGYTCLNTQSSSGGTVELSGNTANFRNKITPTAGMVAAHKTVKMGTDEAVPYSGSMFSFTLAGLPEMAAKNGYAKSENTTDTNMTAGEVLNGNFSFNISFRQKGVYCYKLTENAFGEDEAPYAENKPHYSADIAHDTSVYLVLFEVTEEGSELVVKGPSYFKSTNKATYTYDDFTSANAQAVSTAPTFNNPVQPGSVTINKTNQQNGKLEGIMFAVYKVDDNETLTREQIVSEYNAFGTPASKCVARNTTNANGSVTFSNLSIYADNWYNEAAEPLYQRYAVAELDPNNGYNLNGEVHYFTLPMWSAQDNEWKYAITYDYVNGKIINPNTSGTGMIIFRTVGLAMLSASMLMLFGFLGVYFYKKRVSQKRAKHIH